MNDNDMDYHQSYPGMQLIRLYDKQAFSFFVNFLFFVLPFFILKSLNIYYKYQVLFQGNVKGNVYCKTKAVSVNSK